MRILKELALLLLFLPGMLSAQNFVPCSAPDSIYNSYRFDADQLAVLNAVLQQTNWKDSSQINYEYSDSILKAIMALYQSQSPQRDTIFDLLNIHSFQEIFLDELYITYDTNYSWINKLSQNNFPTGNTTMDSLITHHSLNVSNVDSTSTYTRLKLTTDTSYNLFPVTELIMTLPGIRTSDPGMYRGSGNNIFEVFTPAYTQITFSYCWSDGVHLCYPRRNWEFRVFQNCSVQFVRSYGDVIPANIMSHQMDFVKQDVYPNPFSSELNIQSDTEAIRSLRIYDSRGRLIKSMIIEDRLFTFTWPLEFLVPGLYFLRVNEGKVYKLLKEE